MGLSPTPGFFRYGLGFHHFLGFFLVKFEFALRDGGASIVGTGVVPKEAKDAELLVLSSTGYGKKTKLSEYKIQGRGGSGIKTMSITPKTKQLVGGAVIQGGGELVAMSKKSQTIRTGLDEIPTLSRATQGVRVMKMREGDSVASFVIFEAGETAA